MSQRGTSGGDAATRWRSLVRARVGEVKRLDPGRETVSSRYWDSRARRWAAQMAGTVGRDPFLARVRRLVGRRTTVLDVGAGAGRFALALAPSAAEVVAVDPSQGMLDVLRGDARRRRLGNVRCVHGRWEDVEVATADVAICAYVLPIIAEPAPFLLKLDGAARRRVLLYLSAFSLDALYDPLWRHFHGRPRAPGPSYLDAAQLLRQLGLRPQVEVVEVDSARYTSMADAVRQNRDYLLLPDTAEVRRELKGLLSQWLVRDAAGWRLPVRTLPAGILSWTPSGR